ncbi:MAG: DUF3048 C-terminal domain-containing protein, partial [Candidatus Atribacteria bacterium]|nr:DUF3048 C-terminal domain-containing protein [Candidatus Atribacteria bacterium]
NTLGHKISIKYHNDYIVNYEYHQDEKKYFRYVERKNNGIDHGKINKTMVSNIIVQYAVIDKIDQDTLGRVDVQLVGEGIAKVFSAGNYQIAKWVKKEKNDQTLFLSEKGYPISLNQGLTWVHILSPDLNVWFK